MYRDAANYIIYCMIQVTTPEQKNYKQTKITVLTLHKAKNLR